jgi:hypothetical protein
MNDTVYTPPTLVLRTVAVYERIVIEPFLTVYSLYYTGITVECQSELVKNGGDWWCFEARIQGFWGKNGAKR